MNVFALCVGIAVALLGGQMGWPFLTTALAALGTPALLLFAASFAKRNT